MIKILFKLLRVVVLFLFFWFLNNGFLNTPSWQIIQAGVFTLVTLSMFKYTKLKTLYWFYLIVFLYIASAILEMANVQVFPNVIASTGFGILVILIVVHTVKKIFSQRDP